MPTFQFVAALAAAGKTYEAIRYAVAGVRGGERFIFAVPSKDLVDQITADIRAAGCERVTACHSDDGHEQSVTGRLTRHFKEVDHSGPGEIVVMTMAALERMKFIARRGDWYLIVDEVPTPVYHRRFVLNENKELLMSLIGDTPWNAAYSLLQPSETDTGMVVDRARNLFKDEATAIVVDVANKLLSPHWQVYAGNDQLAVMRQDEDQERALDVFGLMSPSIFEGFRSVTIMGACFKDTLLYRHWLAQGVTFEPHPRIKPRFGRYPNADLVTVKYAIDRDWSARLRDTEIDGKRVLDHVAERMRAEVGDAPYVYLVNKKNEANLPMDGEMLPRVSHGLNGFSRYHNALLLPALNPPPAYFGFIRDMAHIDPDEVKTAIYRAACYQAGLRISIRDLDNRDPKTIMVADRSTAEWLGHLIGTAKIERLPGSDIVPPDGRRVIRPKTDAERCQKYKNEKKAELVLGLDAVNGLGDTTSFTIKDTVSPDMFHVGDLFRDKYSALAALDTIGMSVLAFKDFLAEAWRGNIVAKENRPLICPCHFDPNKSVDTSRGADNIVSISGIWLDNDGGDLTAEEFSSWFRVPMCIFNSFNSTANAPRWRVWIPTSHLITADVHIHILAQIRQMLTKRGYYGKSYITKYPNRKAKHHGFDEGKMTRAVLFYLPAQADAGPGASFFAEHNWDKPVLNPYLWVDRTIVDERPPTIPTAPVQPPVAVAEASSDGVDQAKVGAAVEQWRCHPKGTGDQAFFALAVGLCYAGMSWPDAQFTLMSEAIYSHSDTSRRERLADMRSYERKIWGGYRRAA